MGISEQWSKGMKNHAYALLLAAGLAPGVASAAGFVDLPASGFNVNDGISAYTICNATAKPGKQSRRIKATPGQHDECAVFPANPAQAPIDGFNIVTHAVRTAVMNNTYTGGIDKKVATVTEFVWRNASQAECIYGASVVALLGTDADYDTEKPGKQYFRISDFARAGFGGLPVAAAYYPHAVTAEPVYRIGRTYTAVQYRDTDGYVGQPLTTPVFNRSINGINTAAATSPLPEQQSASLNDGWVNFATAIGLPKRAASSVFYVKSTCTSAAPQTVPDAIRLRQTSPPFIEVSVPGFAPAGGAVGPAPVKPY
ncbi:MAG: hypothetical protein CVU35_01540 [Betaproteobacteria bacterium HGW-Betaproteobacteria-8]|nr:MAG: hypothetical protein CVU35_01540 [Betaproteobacteria bacterium HGW-Betaproteobacteria-8]